MAFVVVRVRGTVNVNGRIQETMRMLRLSRPNHAVIIPNDPSHVGMLKVVKDYVTYGEVDAGTAEKLLKERGRLLGDKPLDDAGIAKATENKYRSVGDFARALANGEAKVKDLGDDFKPLFRLHPPRGGHTGIKRHYTVGGALGYRGKNINQLVGRML